jgi:hypothetical protein
MEAMFAELPLSLSQTSEPLAILLWGFVLILTSVRVRAGAPTPRPEVVKDSEVATAGRSVVVRA